MLLNRQLVAMVKIRGVEHYVEWVRQPGESSKPVMVFMHGWGGSSRYWQTTAQAMADRYDCLLYDLRGFGRSRLPVDASTQPHEYELETYAEDLAELLDNLGLDRVYLHAHSTGTSMAVFFLNLFPKRVERAILTCSGIFKYDKLAFSLFHRFGTYVVQFRPRWLGQIPGMERLFMARFLSQSIPGQMQKEFLADFLVADYAAALGTMLTAVSEKAATVMPQEFAQVQVPTLLVSGDFDQIIPVPLGQAAAAQNPLIEHVVIPNTGHFPMLEAATTYRTVVDGFLEKKHSYDHSTENTLRNYSR